MSDRSTNESQFPRRTFLKAGAAGAAVVAAGTGASIIVPRLRQKGLMSGNGLFEDLQHDIAPVSGHALAQGLTVASFAHIICAELV